MGLLSWRHFTGIALALALLLGGRLVRQRMLIGPDGSWREQLWLDSLLVRPAEAEAATRQPKPVLTTPLPINTCSEDSLTLLPGVGRVLAGRIAAERDSGTVFCTAADLRRVKGIGPALSARLDSLVIYADSVLSDTISSSYP